jgi:hypothetical protein
MQEHADSLVSRVNKMYEDMYIGRGKLDPPMTVRLSDLEAITKSINSNLSKLAWLGISTLAAVVGEIILRALK